MHVHAHLMNDPTDTFHSRVMLRPTAPSNPGAGWSPASTPASSGTCAQPFVLPLQQSEVRFATLATGFSGTVSQGSACDAVLLMREAMCCRKRCGAPQSTQVGRSRSSSGSWMGWCGGCGVGVVRPGARDVPARLICEWIIHGSCIMWDLARFGEANSAAFSVDSCSTNQNEGPAGFLHV